MQTHNITFIEVEQDAVQPIVDRISRSYRFVSVEKKAGFLILILISPKTRLLSGR